MTVKEYLAHSFEPDAEYLDGCLTKRNAGEWAHSVALSSILFRLADCAEASGLRVVPVIRIRISESRYRVADIGVWRAGNIGDRIPTVPPLLVIEILSPEDRMVRMLPKIQEYLSIGTEWIWVIDPDERKALIYSQAAPAGVLSDTLRAENPDLEIPLSEVLPKSS